MNEVESELKASFGLNSYEARAYLALVRSPMKAKELSSAANIPMPRVYDTVKSLEAKGFIHETGGTYVAEAPSVALRAQMLSFQRSFQQEKESRESAMVRIVKLLRPVVGSEGGSEEPVLLRGINAIAGKFIEVLGASSDVVLMVRKALKIKGVFRGYLEALPLTGKRVRLVLPSSPRISASDAAFLSSLGIERRVHAHPVLDVMVADELDVILGVPDRSNDEPFSAIALWVRNRSFAKSTRSAMEEIWRESGKK